MINKRDRDTSGKRCGCPKWAFIKFSKELDKGPQTTSVGEENNRCRTSSFRVCLAYLNNSGGFSRNLGSRLTSKPATPWDNSQGSEGGTRILINHTFSTEIYNTCLWAKVPPGVYKKPEDSHTKSGLPHLLDERQKPLQARNCFCFLSPRTTMTWMTENLRRHKFDI